MKLIVGLGNFEKKYFNTFHNLGFMAVDKISEKLNIEFTKKTCKSMVAETVIAGEKILLCKPLTYMNLSGEAIRELISFYKIDLKDLLVIYDDVDLPKGTIRIRAEGSSGTHNGMRNIVKELNSTEFKRIRIGYKQENVLHPIPLIDYVLTDIPPSEKEIFDKAILSCANAGIDFINKVDIQDIMQKYSGVVKD